MTHLAFRDIGNRTRDAFSDFAAKMRENHNRRSLNRMIAGFKAYTETGRDWKYHALGYALAKPEKAGKIDVDGMKREIDAEIGAFLSKYFGDRVRFYGHMQDLCMFELYTRLTEEETGFSAEERRMILGSTMAMMADSRKHGAFNSAKAMQDTLEIFMAAMTTCPGYFKGMEPAEREFLIKRVVFWGIDRIRIHPGFDDGPDWIPGSDHTEAVKAGKKRLIDYMASNGLNVHLEIEDTRQGTRYTNVKMTVDGENSMVSYPASTCDMRMAEILKARKAANP